MLLPTQHLPLLKITKMEQRGIFSPLQQNAIKPLHLPCSQPKQECEEVLDFIIIIIFHAD